MYRKIFVLLDLLSMLFTQRATATHFSSADLSATYIGNAASPNKYRITLVVYKFCESNAVDLSKTREVILVQSTALGLNDTVSLPAVGTEDTLDQLCAAFSASNSCHNASSIYPGYARRVYTDTLSLPGRANDYLFSWNNGSRNGGILNLANPSGQEIYIEAGLNNLNRVNCSTPVFTGSPIAYICANNTTEFLNSPVDIDGDSMVTLNRWPESLHYVQIPYASGFSLFNPFGSSTVFMVNPLTGSATFLPMNTGKYVISFRTDKYDRATGTLLGYTTRDIQVAVLACSNPNPTITSTPQNLTGGTQAANGLIVANVGANLAFDITTSNQSGGNTIVLNGNHISGAAGSIFSTGNPINGTVVGHFSWSPTVVDTGYHLITFTGTDSICSPVLPIVARSSTIVPIQIVNPNGGVGIREAQIPNMILSPNPATDRLYVQSGSGQIREFMVLDMTGRVVLKAGNSGDVIDLKNMVSGHYILKASGNFGVYYSRFVKQ